MIIHSLLCPRLHLPPPWQLLPALVLFLVAMPERPAEAGRRAHAVLFMAVTGLCGHPCFQKFVKFCLASGAFFSS